MIFGHFRPKFDCKYNFIFFFVLQDGEETDPETDEANENYETLDMNDTTDVNNSSLNWTLSSTINQNDSSSEILHESTAAGFCNEIRPTAQQFASLNEEGNIDAFRKYLQVCFNSNELRHLDLLF